MRQAVQIISSLLLKECGLFGIERNQHGVVEGAVAAMNVEIELVLIAEQKPSMGLMIDDLHVFPGKKEPAACDATG